MDLFRAAAARAGVNKPLADRMRPTSLAEVLGQEQLLGKNRLLQRLIARGQVPSMILWGPPGCGKTSLARVLATATDAAWESLSTVMGGVAQLRQLVAQADERRAYHSRHTLLFIDEIHRFNKAQQDALLPHVESGLLTLIGATTENPSFEVNPALLSRCRVFVLQPLGPDALVAVLRRALEDTQRGMGQRKTQASEEILAAIASRCDGDARRALNTLEICCGQCAQAGSPEITDVVVEEALQTRLLPHDKSGEAHYQTVSAFIKSMRGSDPDAAIYWMLRLLEAGEDPHFVLRRMVIFASEDVGNADPAALGVAVAAQRAFDFVGLPEAKLILTQAVAYLACAPKSNAALAALTAAGADVDKHGALPVPHKLRNAASALTKQLGHGVGYRYPHDHSGHWVAETYLPQPLQGRRYYEPSDQGAEAAIAAVLRQRRARCAGPEGTT